MVMPKSAPSMKDVAALAGVSIGTVSNVINVPERVSETTQAKVHRAIKELGWQRNEAARQLRAGRSRTIGIVLLDVSNPYFSEVFRGAEDLLLERGYMAYIGNSDHDAERESRLLEEFQKYQVQGVIVAPVGTTSGPAEALSEQGVPVVLIDRGARGGMDGIGDDDVEGGRLAVSHLLSLGHRRIAFAGGPLHLTQIRDRVQGSEQALEVLSVQGEEATLLCFHTPNLDIASGQEAAIYLLSMDEEERPTAVFAANDLVAIGLLQGLVSAGKQVPGDIAIIGYDDIPYAGAAAVPLSSIRQPAREMGRAAAEMLLDRIEEEAAQGQECFAHIDREPEVRQFRPELVVRRSTDPMAL